MKHNPGNRGALVLVAALILSAGCSTTLRPVGEVPFVATPMEVVDRMLELANVTDADTVYDLGSGDGRIIIQAAKRFGARGVGIEIDRSLVERSQQKARQEKVDHRVQFREQDALTVDLSNATVVTLYMLPEFNAQLRPRLEAQLKPGTRVVSHDFPIEGWKPAHVEKIPGGWLHQHTVYLWKVGSQP